MKSQTCCFTGHREIPAELLSDILRNLNAEVERLISAGVTDFVSGGALGFDQLVASLIISKRRPGNGVRLIFALPCKDQDRLWGSEQKNFYRKLLKDADEVVYVSENYSPDCMEKRNRYMVDRSAFCVCALMREKSGAAQTVRYAKRCGVKIINTV